MVLNISYMVLNIAIFFSYMVLNIAIFFPKGAFKENFIIIKNIS